MAAGDLITLPEAKDYIGLKVSDKDALIAALVSAASARMNSLCSRNILQAAQTEVRHGNNRGRIRVFNPPVAATPLPTVTENGTALLVTVGYDVTADVAVSLEDGVFIRQLGSTPIVAPFGWFPGRWTPGTNNVSIGYTGGFSPVPEDLKTVVKEMVGMTWRHVDRREIGLDAVGDGAGGSVKTSQDLPKWCKEIIGIYSMPRVPET